MKTLKIAFLCAANWLYQAIRDKFHTPKSMFRAGNKENLYTQIHDNE